MARKKGSKDYPLELKLRAIQMHLEQEQSYAEITKQLGIRDPNRVKKWVTKYRREGEAGFSQVRRGRPRKVDSQAAYIKQLEIENELLKALHIELGEDLPDGLDID